MSKQEIIPMKTQPIIPVDFDTAWRMSVAISKSGLAPRGIQTAEAIFTAIQLGAEVGLTPMSALQNIAVVNGRPSIWGDAQLALVRASGMLEKFIETYEGKEGEDAYRAVCVVKRFGEGEISNNFSIADAKQAGLWNKEGPWRTNWKRMLKMRARSFSLRDGFTDILKGIYSVEEAKDIPPSTAIDGTFKNVSDLNSEFNSAGKAQIAVDPTTQPPEGQEFTESSTAKTKPAKKKVETPHDPNTGEIDEKAEKKAAQREVQELHDVLENMAPDLRPAAFLAVDGMDSLNRAGRSDLVDEAFTKLGINLPPRE